MAFGFSALAIAEEVEKNGGRHCAIDKFQQQDWGNNGIDLVRQGGYGEKFDFYEDFSYRILPK